MNRVSVHLGYEDGSEEDVILKPVALVAAERHFKGTVPPVEGTLWAAWHSLRVPATFADWLESVVSIEEQLVPPTSATAPTPSPTSPSQPADRSPSSSSLTPPTSPPSPTQ